MRCKSKGCDNEELISFRYCNNHLCEKIKKDGTRCRNKKFKGNFCFLHSKYIFNKISFLGLVIGILAIIITLFLFLFGDKILSLIWGQIYIDFKENPEDIVYVEGNPYIKIEVLNELRYSLLNVNGTVTIRCEDKHNQIISKTFKLKESGKFLPSNTKDYLIAYDQLFVDLLNTKEDSCSDASYVVGKYKAINYTHAKLIEIKSYEFFNDREPIKINYDIGETIKSDSCLRCNITTEIHASNTNKDFSKTEVHKFLGLHAIINPLKEVISYRDMSEEFYMTYSGVLHSFKPCEEITGEECSILLCDELNKHFQLGIACEETKDLGTCTFPNYGTAVIDPVDSCI